jgi:hypothetical protein
MTVTTMYDKLKLHLRNHIYKRGRNTGDAPAIHNNRAKAHFRVAEDVYGQCMEVIFHRTTIIRAFPGGQIVINMGGYEDSPTTRAAFAYAMAKFGPFKASIFAYRTMGLSQTCVQLYTPKILTKLYRYYPRMRFDEEGLLLTAEAPFQAKRKDKVKTAALRASLVESGFMALLPILYATCEREGVKLIPAILKMTLENAESASHWMEVVRYVKYRGNWSRNETPRTLAETRAALMKELTNTMYTVTDTDITTITII